MNEGMSEYVTFDQLREEQRKKPDLVEVVRCLDCKKCNIGWCLHFKSIVKPEGFCAWGERRASE